MTSASRPACGAWHFHQRVALLFAITPWLSAQVAGEEPTANAKRAPDPAPAMAAPQEPAPAKPETTILRAVCSDSLLELAQALAEAWHEKTPAVAVKVTGGGSSIAVNCLKDGSAQLAFSTRVLRRVELDGIRAKGFEPLEQVIGHEALAIVVHRDNPIASLTVAQLTQMWIQKGAVERWSQIDVKLQNVTDERIALVGSQSNSGSHEFFRAAVLGRGVMSLGTYYLGTEEVAALVGKTPAAIGFCPPEYAVDQGVRTVPLAVEEKGKTRLLTATDDGYPLRRASYVYFRDAASGTAKSFATWIRSPDGAAIVQRCGLQPPARGR